MVVKLRRQDRNVRPKIRVDPRMRVRHPSLDIGIGEWRLFGSR
jgi:hypothetical protein